MKNIIKNHYITIIFIIVIISGFVFSFGKAFKQAKNSVKDFANKDIVTCIKNYEKNYNSIFSKEEYWLDLFSIIQLCLFKRETRNFEVLKDSENHLYLGTDSKINIAEIKESISQIMALKKETESYGGRFVFIQLPYKNYSNQSSLKGYLQDCRVESQNLFLENISQNKIKYLDLRTISECNNFYKTDHHWTVEAAFTASSNIVKYIVNQYAIKLENIDFKTNINNYEIINQKNSFLGSIGVKVGKYYAGKDDFKIYKPRFKTDLSFKHIVNSKITTDLKGDFINIFIDLNKLQDNNYLNKYYTLMFGAYYESIIINHLCPNNYKVLLITHSYGRALSPYLSLYFKELRFLDPQKGRYNSSYLEYIKAFKSDFVFYAYNNNLIKL